MDRLYEQMRLRSINSENKDRKATSIREGQTPSRKTVSFKEEKEMNWFPRLSSDKRSQVDEADDSVFATAIAAATYAISSFEEDSSNRKMPTGRLQTSSSKSKSRKDDNIPKKTDAGSISRWFSSKDAKEYRGAVGSKRFTDEQGKITAQHASAIVKAPTLRTSNGKLNLTNSGHTNVKRDAWEKAELEKIQKRHREMYSSIVQWESKKKRKAKHRLEQKEMELQEKRAKAMEEYNFEIARIDKIVAGAKSVTDEKMKKDEAAVRTKANKIGSTGNVPRACWCF